MKILPNYKISNLLIFLLKFTVFILAESSGDEIFSCKSCGHEIASFKDNIFKKSPYSIKTWNESIIHIDHFDSQFNRPVNQSLKPDIFNPYYTVQLLENPQKNNFKLILFSKSNIKLLNETTSLEYTWFPSFKWTIGLCPHCLFHLGWHFESIIGENSFFGLILDKLIKKTDAESLILEPKLKMY